MSAFLRADPVTLLEKANLSYQAAEKAATFPERKKAFNDALFLYLQVEAQVGEQSSQLNQALANTFFELGEYAQSILYNERARLLDPLNPHIAEHIALAKVKLGLNPAPTPYTWWETILLKPFFSIQQRLQLFFWLCLLAIALSTAAIWSLYPFVKWLAFLTSSLALLLLLNLAVAYYFSPIEGILVTSTGLYRGPSFEETQLIEQPLLAGNKVQVIQTAQQGKWLKIRDPEQRYVGYVQLSTVRII